MAITADYVRQVFKGMEMERSSLSMLCILDLLLCGLILLTQFV
jgi:hypothetical protein